MTSEGGYWFPGRWLGGMSMILAPLLMLAGVLLRFQFHFFFPEQLSAFEEHPRLMTASYNLFLAANILLWPGILSLAQMIGANRPGLGTWGGALVLFGLFARTFHAGVDHLAFQLVRIQDLSGATSAVAGAYPAFHVVTALTPAILFGWIVLAIGAYRLGTLGLLRSISLGMMSALMIGVLKGSSLTSVVAASGLCVALVPLGVRVLREPPEPTVKDYLRWLVFTAGLATGMFALGRLG